MLRCHRRRLRLLRPRQELLHRPRRLDFPQQPLGPVTQPRRPVGRDPGPGLYRPQDRPCLRLRRPGALEAHGAHFQDSRVQVVEIGPVSVGPSLAMSPRRVAAQGPQLSEWGRPAPRVAGSLDFSLMQ